MRRLALDSARFIITFVFAAVFFVMLAVIVEDVRADGLDDAKFYGKVEYQSSPNEIEVWTQHNGVWLKELPRDLLPNGHYMLSEHNVNYYRDFNQYPCHYSDVGKPRAKCNESSSAILFNNDPIVKRSVPEPELLLMLGVGLVGLGVKRWK